MFLETKEVSRVLFKESVNCVSRKFQEKVSRIFQEGFNEVLLSNFVLACISSQLPEEQEGLSVFIS